MKTFWILAAKNRRVEYKSCDPSWRKNRGRTFHFRTTQNAVFRLFWWWHEIIHMWSRWECKEIYTRVRRQWVQKQNKTKTSSTRKTERWINILERGTRKEEERRKAEIGKAVFPRYKVEKKNRNGTSREETRGRLYEDDKTCWNVRITTYLKNTEEISMVQV